MANQSLSRRRFLALTGGAAAAVAGSGLLAACGSSSTPTTGGAGSVTFPEYAPATLVKPDLPATADGVMAGFYDYPANLATAFTSKPGEGLGNVTVLTNMFNPVPPGAGSNAYWQEVNTQLGATLDITMTPSADYLSKLSTVIAGGQLPDMTLISSKLAHRADVLTRLCADLSEFVSGSAITEYPFLANIPKDAWLSTAYGGGIFAVPIPRGIAGTIFFARDDLIRAKGLNTAPASYAEFVRLAEGLTDAKANKWAFGGIKRVIVFAGTMLGVPNTWRADNGKFVSEFETEQRKEAVARTAELYKKGLFHPDSLGGKLQVRDLFGNGTIALHGDGYAAWDTMAAAYKVEIGAMPAPKADGGGIAQHPAGAASFAITAFKKGDKARIKQLLKICDWLAAPLGTKEYMFRKFGVEGTHYTMQDGKPVLTDKGKVEVKLPLEYIIDAPPILGPGDRARVDAQRAYQEKIVPTILRNPAEGLYSATAVDKAGEMSKIIDAAELDIVSGRKPIAYWDEAVTAWKKAGGDAARAEYEKAQSTK
ncbi:putative aldouronate transport system substrate-binding protein [Hamadaea flava]|uniref:Extracellular solute-binding protein n=1 Tax=Hamadaea flava TaxID=1742688 RepID=A0ABV8LXM4_9ACTN|nr:extracellular solute-binding protein [Hamadaea flava]MCP2329429.1 putative aldouronate transport system substrate-binding protein [Hamadaea flava]